MSGGDFAALMLVSIITTVTMWWAIETLVSELRTDHGRYSWPALVVAWAWPVILLALGLGLLYFDFLVARELL